MPAKDYQLLVTAFGTVYIGKTSKTQKNLMLNDRKEVDKNAVYQFIEEFAKANIEEGFSTLEVKNKDGELSFELRLPNPRLKSRAIFMEGMATGSLMLIKDLTPEKRNQLNQTNEIIDTMEQLAKYILEISQ